MAEVVAVFAFSFRFERFDNCIVEYYYDKYAIFWFGLMVLRSRGWVLGFASRWVCDKLDTRLLIIVNSPMKLKNCVGGKFGFVLRGGFMES